MPIFLDGTVIRDLAPLNPHQFAILESTGALFCYDCCMKNQKIIVNGIIVENGCVLIAKRSASKKIAPGKYHLPGGHVVFGENPDDAIVREFNEEFGLTVVAGKVSSTFSYVIGDIHTVGITFLLTTSESLQNIKFDKEDNEEIVWMEKSNIKEYFDVTDNDFITLSKYFGEHKAH